MENIFLERWVSQNLLEMREEWAAVLDVKNKLWIDYEVCALSPSGWAFQRRFHLYLYTTWDVPLLMCVGFAFGLQPFSPPSLPLLSRVLSPWQCFTEVPKASSCSTSDGFLKCHELLLNSVVVFWSHKLMHNSDFSKGSVPEMLL